ncbi:c-type cytochrome [Undibacterium arcticum]|uniref:C-type cytochrome n=1 Tax=Undibacterium arcticum TaxID=1762892 RepID=A0ABV7EXU6_9BURK
MKRALQIFLIVMVVAFAATVGFGLREDSNDATVSQPASYPAEQVTRGAYLARAGDCMACHTARGQAAYAGGLALPTPFGKVITPNITPDAETGIGSWSADDFWRALHNGKSKDGSLLYPAFPYTNYTKVTRADADAMYAYFKTVPPVRRQNQAHQLRFPYNHRILLVGWRMLYFRPGVYQPRAAQSAEWNRGAYLVQGLGHCSACHSDRNALGAVSSKADLGGGLIPTMNWFAPSLTSDSETGLGTWAPQEIASLLKTGVSNRGTVFGPMAEVVAQSLQHLSDSDIDAMSGYLKASSAKVLTPDVEAALKLGAKLYQTHCAACHQTGGEGAPPIYPPLAGNRAITMPSAVNPIRMVLNGGFPPGTSANPRPYGMPPFGPALNDTEVAALVTYIRNSWGNQAGAVSAHEVNQFRGAPLD